MRSPSASVVLPALAALAGLPCACTQSQGQQVFPMEAYTVEAAAEGTVTAAYGDLELGGSSLPASGSLARLLAAAPAVSFESRGPNAVVPVLRGLSQDRVVTTLDGILLPFGAPTLTAAPVNFLSAGGIGRVAVRGGLPGVEQGPVALGGRIEAASARAGSAPQSAELVLAGNPDGWAGAVTLEPEGIAAAALRLSAHASRTGDYRGGGGAVVDADYAAAGVQASGTVDTRAGGALQWAAHYFRQQLARNPALPLDSRDSDAVFLTSAYVVRFGDADLRLKFGYVQERPFLTSADRLPLGASPVRLVEARALTRSQTVGAAVHTAPAQNLSLEAGIDCVWQARDATRWRHTVAGSLLTDHIWPDVRVQQPGAFLQLGGLAGPAVRWRAGIRYEQTRMQARGGESAIIGTPGARGTTLRENFVAFNGAAASLRRDDDSFTAHALVEAPLSRRVSVQAGAALTRAAPGPGHCYRGFLGALGGGQELGNPALAPETARTVSLAFRYRRAGISLTAEAWGSWIDDFVRREVLVADPLIYGFRNRDCRFRGIDLAAGLPLLETAADHVTLEGAFAHTVARDGASGADIAEAGPWQARLLARWSHAAGAGRRELFLEAVMAGARRNPEPETAPLYADTGGHVLWNLGLRMPLRPDWVLSLQVDNLFDRLAYAWLYPPVAAGQLGPSSGTLAPGDRIPEPGRAFRMVLEHSF